MNAIRRPSPVVDATLRAAMGDAAVALARACDYEGAGTVEFVATGDASQFFFLEMNTRLQVEHPVTELVWGVDLVEQQLRIAAGMPLQRPRSEPHGHAVEARIYAEDPGAGFLPATGTIRHYREPAGARVDSGVRAGHEVTTDYDPMLAKLVVHGEDRAGALRALDRALADFELLGVATNIAFTRALVSREDVRRGAIDTGLLERVLDELTPEPPADLLPAAALAACGTGSPPGPWRRAFVAGEVRIADATASVAELSPGDRTATFAVGGVRALGDGAWRIALDGISRRYVVASDGDDLWVGRDGHGLELRAARRAGGAAAAAGSLEAPMPGTVLMVNVADGDSVREGDVLLVMESMKMELSISAPHAGTVAGLALAAGDRVERGLVLLRVDADDEASA